MTQIPKNVFSAQLCSQRVVFAFEIQQPESQSEAESSSSSEGNSESVAVIIAQIWYKQSTDVSVWDDPNP